MFNYRLGLKDTVRANQLDCIINYFFKLYLILHACVRRFDVTDIVQNFLETKLSLSKPTVPARAGKLCTLDVVRGDSRNGYMNWSFMYD